MQIFGNIIFRIHLNTIYQRSAFGYWVDNAIGGDGADDELGYFNDLLDISYSWDENGIGIAGLLPGIMGFAYLESPGIAYDGVDNDDDGLIDEKEITKQHAMVGPTEGHC